MPKSSSKSRPRRFKGPAFAAIHEAASVLAHVGAIGKTTLREFDEACIVRPTALSPRAIKRLRERQRVSQPVFARYLNMSESTIEKWETGAKRPRGIALKMLELVQRHGIAILAG